MAICEWCQKEMTDPATGGCDHFTYDDYPGLPPQERVRFGQEGIGLGNQPGERCPGCGATVGGYHHPGCDVEQCPVCRGQLIECDCPRADSEAAGAQ